MLIRWATEREREDLGLPKSEYGEFDALVADDRMTDRRLGWAAFSREAKAVRKLDILEGSRKDEVEERLRLCAYRQIDPRGARLHYRYPAYHRDSQQETCPCCTAQPMPERHFDLAELERS